MENTGLIGIFLTGLIAGGLSCMAVQGGLLAATIAQRGEERLKDNIKKGSVLPILSFLIAKLAAYTMFGFLLGLLGSAFELSLTAKTIMQFIVAIFMVGTALNILNVHPIFRYFVIQPPRFLTRLVRKQSKSSDMFAPGLLGAFTVLIPCGITQAMMALAIASGNPMYGAAILFAFVLGTSPVFFILGFLATKLGDTLHQKFMKVAAYAIILLAVFNVNNALALTGSSYTLENTWKGFWCTVSFCNDSSVQAATGANDQNAQAAVDESTISIESDGYNPDKITVKAVSPGNSDTITFTAQSEPGPLAFMCSMGMFRGTINVI